MTKLIKCFPNWAINGIFAKLEAKYSDKLPWIIDNGAILDIEYFGNRSGNKIVSALLDKYIQDNIDQRKSNPIELSDNQISQLADILYTIYGKQWQHLYNVYEIDYKPIENYRMEETRTPDLQKNRTVKSQTDYTVKTESGVKNSTYAFNSSDAVPADESNGETTVNTKGDPDKNVNTENETETGTEKLERFGNIGVTTSQQMLESEINLWKWNFYTSIFEMLDKVLTCNTYQLSVRKRELCITESSGTDGKDGKDGVTPDITVNASVDNSVGVPSVDVTKTGTLEKPIINMAFHNLKGADGKNGTDGVNGTNGTNGKDGVTPNIDIRATVDDMTGIPSADVVKGGDLENPSYIFSFHNLKGADGKNGTDGVNGTNGTNGKDGVTPDITFTSSVSETESGELNVDITKSGTPEAPIFNLDFQNIGGGGKSIYMHYIRLLNSSGTTDYNVRFTIISTKESDYTADDIKTYLSQFGGYAITSYNEYKEQSKDKVTGCGVYLDSESRVVYYAGVGVASTILIPDTRIRVIDIKYKIL